MTQDPNGHTAREPAGLKQAAILVGGLGTRLGDLTRTEPKPLLPVGGRPFVSWLVDDLTRQGIERILLLAGHLGERVREAAARLDPAIEVVTEPEPLGTGGALRHALDRLDERFVLLNGDSVFTVDLQDLASLIGPRAVGAVALRSVPDATRYGAVRLEGRWIVDFAERPPAPGPGVINGGVAVLRRDAIREAPPGRPVSLERELYPLWARQGRLAGRVYDRPFIDIGVPEDLARAQSFVPALFGRGPDGEA